MQNLLVKTSVGQRLVGWGTSARMTNDKDVPAESASTRFRTMRRRSKPRFFSSGSDDGVTNVFQEHEANAAPSTPKPEQPEPRRQAAHVEADTRQLGQVTMLLAPDACPDGLTAALRMTVDRAGRFCDGAYLFQAQYEAGETALMVCFSNVDQQNQSRVEGAVADALMASGHEEHSLGILFLPRESKTLLRISELAVNLKS